MALISSESLGSQFSFDVLLVKISYAVKRWGFGGIGGLVPESQNHPAFWDKSMAKRYAMCAHECAPFWYLTVIWNPQPPS